MQSSRLRQAAELSVEVVWTSFFLISLFFSAWPPLRYPLCLSFRLPRCVILQPFTYLLFHKPRCWFSFIVDLIYFVRLCSIYGFWDKSLTGSLHYRLHKIWFIKVHFVFDVKANTVFDLPLVTWGYRGGGMFLILVKWVPFDFSVETKKGIDICLSVIFELTLIFDYFQTFMYIWVFLNNQHPQQI